MTDILAVTEIYATIQGEARFAGYPCVMVRLSGCPLRCRWCDTAYSFADGEKMPLAVVLEKVRSFGIPHVELTGGEPLAQGLAPKLVEELVKANYQVMIETGGSISVEGLDPKAHIVMDLKCPGSGMVEKNLWSNLDHLKSSDEIKFVIADREDFEWCRMMVREHHLTERFQVLLSAAFGLLPLQDLATWILEEKLPWRLNLQQHKYIWHPRAKGV